MRMQDLTGGSRRGAVEAGTGDALPATLFSGAPVAEIVTDPQGGIREVSAGAAALLRVEPGFLRGAPLRSLVRRSDFSRLSGLLRGEPVHDGAVVRLAVPGGWLVGAELTVTAARNASGRVTGLRWRVHERDRERRRAESAHAVELRRRLEALLAAGHGVCLVAADGTVTWAGEAALAMLGRGTDEVLGARWADLAPEAGDEPVRYALRRGREGSGTFPRFARGDGVETALDYVVVPLIEDDGVVGVALAFTEVGV